MILRISEDEYARQRLIEHNLRLVVYIAKRFENTGVGIEVTAAALIEGNEYVVLGFCISAEIFYKVGRKIKFSADTAVADDK